jgi:hypothetical protein
LKNGSPIPVPNITIGPEHFMPSKNVHGLIGWNNKRHAIFNKIEEKLNRFSSPSKRTKRKSNSSERTSKSKSKTKRR